MGDWRYSEEDISRLGLRERGSPRVQEHVPLPEPSSKVKDFYSAPLGSRGKQHEAGQMNGLEKKYAAHLDIRKAVGEIKAWGFERMKLRLAPKTYYSPDFEIVMTDDSIQLHETKGHWEDDARVKVKVAAAMFPEFRFVGVQWVRVMKNWKYEEFQP